MLLIPLRKIAMVWEPQTSMIRIGRVTTFCRSATRALAMALSRYSSKYFISDPGSRQQLFRHLRRQFPEQAEIFQGLRLDQRVNGETGMDDDIVADARPVIDDIKPDLPADTVGIDYGDLAGGEILRAP